MHVVSEKLMYSGAESFEIAMTNIDIYFCHTARAMHKMPLVPAMIPSEV